jgi:hypothetical protein
MFKCATTEKLEEVKTISIVEGRVDKSEVIYT